MFMMFLHVFLLICAFPPSAAEGRLRQFYILKQTNLSVAVNQCRENYTGLVTVYDQQDNIKLLQLLNQSNFSGGWIGVYGGNYSIKWSNGDDVSYRKIFTSYSDETRCAAMKADGDWESILCKDRKHFMCYTKEAGGASYIYSLILENKSWFDAQLYCRKNHSDLVSIRNEEENDLVMKKGNQSNSPFWIGLLEDSVDWKDGGRSAYRNWLNQTDQGKHVYMSIGRGQWKNGTIGNYYPLCYKSFIHVSPDIMSWEDAMNYCSNQNFSGALFLTSENDQTETQRELNRHNIKDPVWVGLRQSRLFGFWIWINGLQVANWTNWKGGITPELPFSQHCAAMEKVDGQYTLSDKDCRSTYKVLCEENYRT